MKTKIGPGVLSRVRTPAPEVPRFNPENHSQASLTPHCEACQHKVDLLEEAAILLPGQWVPNGELGEPIFVLDPDVPLQFVVLPNGQYALAAPGGGPVVGLVKHVHADCQERMIAEAHGDLDYYGFDERGEF